MHFLSSLSLILMMGFFVLPITGIIIALSGGQHHYDHFASPDCVLFRRSRARRVGAAVAGLGLLSPMLGFSLAAYDNPFSRSIGTALIISLLCVPLGLVYFLAAVPDAIHFNPVIRTYERTIGWRFFAKTSSSSMSLIQGVFICSHARGHLVGVSGVNLWPKNVYLSNFTQQSAAEVFASQVMEKLDVPRCSPPIWLSKQPRISLRR